MKENWQPVDMWPELIHDGQILKSESYCKISDPDHFRLFFWSSSRPSPKESMNYERHGAHLGFRKVGETAIILGMLARETMRGNRIGRAMVEHFLKYAESITSLAPDGTAIIRKPIIALSLMDAGLQPLSEENTYEVLPCSKYTSTAEIPNVRIVSQVSPEEDLINIGPGGKPFYHVLTDAEVKKHYPVFTPGPQVALHTNYDLPG